MGCRSSLVLASGSTAILGSITGGVTTESGWGTVSGCFTIPGSRVPGALSGCAGFDFSVEGSCGVLEGGD
jgi:hypothetical protein